MYLYVGIQTFASQPAYIFAVVDGKEGGSIIPTTQYYHGEYWVMGKDYSRTTVADRESEMINPSMTPGPSRAVE